MTGPTISGIWRTASFTVFGTLCILVPMAPFAPGGAQAAADLFFCFVVAWVLLAPRSAPIWLILPMGLLADFLLSRPVGLGALALLIASEAARNNSGYMRDVRFVYQCIAAWLGFNLLLLGQVLVLKLVMVPAPSMEALIRISIATGVAYPAVALLLSRGLRLGRGAAREDYGLERLS